MSGLENPSMLKLCLGDYGEIQINHNNKSSNQSKKGETIYNNLNENNISEGQTEVSVREWQ